MKSEKSKTMGFFCKQRIAQPTGKPDGKGLRFFKVEAALKLYAFIDLSVALAAGYPKSCAAPLRYANQTFHHPFHFDNRSVQAGQKDTYRIMTKQEHLSQAVRNLLSKK